jgi:hypothetical protein
MMQQFVAHDTFARAGRPAKLPMPLRVSSMVAASLLLWGTILIPFLV